MNEIYISTFQLKLLISILMADKIEGKVKSSIDKKAQLIQKKISTKKTYYL